LGTEEDGVDEAGRATEPSVMVAPPGQDADQKAGASQNGADSPRGDAVTEASASSGSSGSSGSSAPSSQAAVPFPADEIGKPKDSAPPAAGFRAATTGARSPGAGAGSATGSATSSGKKDGDRRGENSGSGNGVLDTGRQAVRQAMAATNNWFARTSKSDSGPPAGSGKAESSAGSGGSRKPSFTPSSAQPSGPSYYAPPSAFPTTAQSSAVTAAGQRLSGPARGTGTGPGVPPGAQSSTTGGDAASRAAGLSSGAAAAVSGAAAGLAGYANSVTSAWQNRGAGARRGNRTVRRSARRQAQLTLSRVEPWSVMKFSFVVSVVAFIILFVAVAVLYSVLSALGVFTSLQHTVTTITSSQGSAGTNILPWFSESKILGYTGMLGALNIVLITAMSTIGAVIYNLIAKAFGGIEITLRETE
jgi:hypothetical protein